MAADRTPPKRQRLNIAADDRDLPEAGIAAENFLGGSAADAVAAMFPDDEELRHVAIGVAAAVGDGVDQHKAGKMTVAPDEQRHASKLAPIGLERIVPEEPVVLQLAPWRSCPKLREIVDIKLHQAGQRRLCSGSASS